MKKRRKRRRLTSDVLWSIVVGLLAIGGILVCAYYQEDLRSSGMRLALIGAAISLGVGAGLIADRMTASRRSSRRIGPNRKTRRHMRSVAFAVTGVVLAACILAVYMAHQPWIIVVTAVVVLAATWLWYVLESRKLSRGTGARRLPDREE